MKAFRITRVVAVTALIMMVSACTIGPTRGEAPRLHLLEWDGSGVEAAAERRDAVLLIATPSASPGHESAAMKYRQQGYELRQFARNRWADKPARLIATALTEALEDSGQFRHVAAPGSRVNADYRLDSELVRLEQLFENEASGLRLTIRYRLVDLKTGEVLGSLRQELRESSESNDPAGGVAAANRALNKGLLALLEALPAWLEAATDHD
ncbi:ABC-type transport auxiliary lipoprotein family protein [Gammaproteobacteria bacterium AB-CW1]|uniref:ABC-type transport auxiliary lipoprotein family protein n=2 Tax=Natronospira TaxID=2024969 RepID=A0AAP6MMM6_9GAMM|nr:ABC-type transport auxiliary lipoprotein family protein [Gammaproteobacteria bacterium AB-CW1]